MSHRVNKKTSELVAIPPTTWYVRTVSWLLEQEEFVKNYNQIPVNLSLLESLERDGMINPILTMPDWYPIAGSQRLRAAAESKNDKLLDQWIRVARLIRI